MDIRTNVASPEIDPAIVAEMQSEMTRLRQAVDELANTLAEVQASLALWKHETQRRFETFSVVIPDLQIAIQETRQRQSVIEGMVSQVSSEAERLDRLAADLIRRQLDLAGERSGLDAKSAALAFREESLSRTPPCFQGGPADNAPTHGVWQSTGRDEIPGTFLEENDISHGANECRRDALKPRSGERVETFAAPVDASDPIQAKPQERPACGVSLYFQEDQRDQIKSEEQAILVRDRIGNESFPKEQSNREAAPVDRDRSDLHSSAKAFDESDREHQVVIQDYVARLLKKTTSDQPEKGETRQSSGECAPRKDVISGSGSPNQTDGNAARRRTAVSRQWGFVRKRAQAPEKNTNFAAMRELANLSSQAAIDRYAKAKLHKVLRGKLLVLLVCLVCGVGLGTLDLWLGIGPLGRAAIVLDFIVMVVYGIQYGLLTGRLIINPKGQLQLAERRIGREMRKLLPVAKPSLVESNASDVTQKRVSSGVAK